MFVKVDEPDTVKEPVIITEPVTSKFTDGVDFPIPTLPEKYPLPTK